MAKRSSGSSRDRRTLTANRRVKPEPKHPPPLPRRRGKARRRPSLDAVSMSGGVRRCLGAQTSQLAQVLATPGGPAPSANLPARQRQPARRGKGTGRRPYVSRGSRDGRRNDVWEPSRMDTVVVGQRCLSSSTDDILEYFGPDIRTSR